MGCIFILGLGGCASPRFTTDDGRPVNEVLLGHIHAYGRGEQAIRPAIVRSAALQDPACDRQWELPFSVASSESWNEDDRVAWVRALGVDERLTVVASAPGSPLRRGEKIDAIEGRRHPRDAQAMLELLVARRNSGRPFQTQTSEGREVTVSPVEVCRGHTRLADPRSPEMQDYHWTHSMHPLEVVGEGLSEDEALWMVLWTRGLSEEAGARMKTWYYGSKLVGTLYHAVTLASGLKGAVVAVEAGRKAAQAAAGQAASHLLRQQVLEQARALTQDKVRDALGGVVEHLARSTVVGAMQQAALNRGALSGVAWMGASVFDRADRWAFERLAKLQANPLAGFALHQRLAAAGLATNAFVFDTERLQALSGHAAAQGMEHDVQALLEGVDADHQGVTLDLPPAMPLASEWVGIGLERSPSAQAFPVQGRSAAVEPAPASSARTSKVLP